MQDKPTVSIIMAVYNHEAYLSHAIESVVSQKTDFPFELLIGEDHSPDNSLAISLKYQKEYPDIVHVYAREKNMESEHNICDLWKHARGEYIIHLEGDDYWTDDHKLQKQVDFLEKHPEYIACAHYFSVVDKNEHKYFDQDFECQFFQYNNSSQDTDYTLETFENGQMLSHINTILYRNIYTLKPEYACALLTWDYAIIAMLALEGKCYCMSEYMSCYRKVTDSGSSYSARETKGNSRNEMFKTVLALEKFFDYRIDFTAKKKAVFASAVFKWYREKSRKNFHIVINIIRLSQQPGTYFSWLFYLISMRLFLNITGKRNRRVCF